MIFPNLPQDIIVVIITQLTNRTDLKNLCQVSKGLHQVCLPYLYEGLVLEPSQGRHHLQGINIEPLRLARERGYLSYTRDIEFTAKSNQRGCIHPRHPYIVADKISRSVMPLLEALKDGNLRSLNWDLGICVPAPILGPSGYFPLKQTNIKSLRVVTDEWCSMAAPLDFSSFPKLKRLSWVGYSSQHVIDAVAAAIRQTSHQLVEMSVDIGPRDVHGTTSISEHDAIFAKHILGLPERGIRKFVALKGLSLSRVSFTGNDTSDVADWSSDYELIHATRIHPTEQISNLFDFSVLRSLKLRLCPGWEELLEVLMNYPLPIKLVSLEIQSAISDEAEKSEIIAPFLESFEGLEDLFLQLRFPTASARWYIWRSALHHKKTLKRFVLQYRAIDFFESTQYIQGAYDVPNLMLSREDLDTILFDPSQNPLSGLELTGIGLACASNSMKPIATAFVDKKLEILHIRQSGPDFGPYANWSRAAADQGVEFDHTELIPRDDTLPLLGKSFGEFAQWVFGPDGIRSLRILAFGDLSDDFLYGEESCLLCRRELPMNSKTPSVYFRSMTGSDMELWELYNKHREMLEACPTDPRVKTGF